MPESTDSLDHAVDILLARIPGPLRIGAPLGLGKPHRLLNALYARLAAEPARALHLCTALSLDPPDAAGELERRFLDPFVARHFGDDFPRLAYVADQKHDALPPNITIEEFYMQSGALLGAAQAQRDHSSLNYTHVARIMAERGLDGIVQKVAASPDGARLSLSSNTDITFDVLDALRAAGRPRPFLVAEVDPELPWLDGTAAVDPDWFDLVVTPPGPHPRLFGLPRQPVSDADHAIGLYASTLVRDGGTLQIGIGALSDALCHALVLRHRDNPSYRRVLHALDPQIHQHPAVLASGGLEPFTAGLYGSSEMLTDGFKLLLEAGVIRRKVIDDEPLMRRIADGSADAQDLARLAHAGQFLHGAFYLGSTDFYAWLRRLPEDTRRHIDMRRVSEVNALPHGRESLARLQRRDARFFNTCMLATVLGAAVSDGLEDGRVVSGVGGQYNFVAMAHDLPDARSALLLRATRETRGRAESNIRWSYGHTTIPRHLRDLYISEYGLADVRGKTDEECARAMLSITDARFAPELSATACRIGKLAAPLPLSSHDRNTPAHLHAALAPFREDGTLPAYPLGSDFTAVEQRLVAALAWLRARTASPARTLRTVAVTLTTRHPDDAEALHRMDLAAPRSPSEHLYARLLRHALHATA